MATTPTSDEGSSDLPLAKNYLKTPTQADVTIALLPPSATFHPPLAPFTPLTKLSGKRKRLKPSKYDFLKNNAEKKPSPLIHKAVNVSSRKRLKLDLDAPVEISPTMIRAGELQSRLGSDHPTFLKTMVKSHVVSCFWMGLHGRFCRSYLPKEDALMVIEDEKGQKCNVKYIGHRNGLSAGWRKFAVDHKLVEGDVLIFQLVESTKFKVYIVRVNELEQVDRARDLIENNEDKTYKARGKMVYKKYEPHKRSEPPMQIMQSSELKVKSSDLKVKSSDSKVKSSDFKVKSSELKVKSSELKVNSEPEGGSPKLPNLSLQELKSFKDFSIMVNKACIDLELSEEIRIDYYKLCTARKQLIHDELPEGLYYKLVAGMIGETVSIANAIKNCKPTTTKEDFEKWDSSLQSFELMGMKVGFLRDRIRMLEKIAFESEDAKKYADAKEEKHRNTITMKILEEKIADLKECNLKIDAVLSSLKGKGEGYEAVFQEKVNEPW